jgi:hypothetical protein
VFAGVQDERLLQPGAEALFQLAETAEVFPGDPGACLDLDGDYLTVVALEHEVDLVACFGAKVPGGDRRIGPAGLLEYLPDGEGFEQVPTVRGPLRTITGSSASRASATSPSRRLARPVSTPRMFRSYRDWSAIPLLFSVFPDKTFRVSGALPP